MHNRLVLNSILFLSLVIIPGCVKSGSKHAGNHKNHAGETESVHNEHEGEAQTSPGKEGENGHDEHGGESPETHGEEVEIAISPEGVKMAGITLAKALKGRIAVSIDLSGEVGFNEDRYIHITPRFPGIARESKFRVGERVNEGDVVAVVESNESMTLYSLKSSIAGTIIKKHITPGEYLNGQESVYEIADLSSVWVSLAVYQKDASRIRPGLKVTISAVGTGNVAEGVINYVTPIMDAQTRRVTARVVLPNSNGKWRPGTFVDAHIEIGEGEECLMVDKAAVQVLNNKSVVFIQHEPGRFKPVEVAVGESDSRRICILSGLETGVEYVNKGAFEIKAKVVTSALGGHAGHGH